MQIWKLKNYIQDISKIIIASSFKHGRLTEDDSRLPGETFLRKLFFSSYCPLQIWALKICNQDISKLIIASSSNMVSW